MAMPSIPETSVKGSFTGSPQQHRRNESADAPLSGATTGSADEGQAENSTQPVASSSKLPQHLPYNPQLTDSPWFAYPTPTSSELDEELPPYFEGENIPLGELLDRVVRKGYGDMRGLVDKTLPSLSAPKKPRPIIEYAKTTRHALLKYLAILRWKAAVDLVAVLPDGTPQTQFGQSGGTQVNGGTQHFPTPLSLADSTSNSPATQQGPAYNGKGKGKATDEDIKPSVVIRGKVTDAKRIQQFMEHQNLQHDRAIEHVQHAQRIVENFRVRNADLLTAVSLLSLGEYTRLPSNLTDTFLPREPLTPALILDTLRRLDAHILYRLRCVDYVPPDLHVDKIANGRAYFSGGRSLGGHTGSPAWRAEVTVVGFGEGEQGKWWLTGLEWCWRSRQERGEAAGGHSADGEPEREETGKKFEGEERQQILDMANGEILPPRAVSEAEDREDTAKRIPDEEPGSAAAPAAPSVDEASSSTKVDAPLVRLHNFIQYLSLSYQLETLLSQALALANGRWRGQLIVEMDRSQKVLRLKYWIRQRPPAQATAPGQAAVGKRPQASLGAARPPLVGGIISISVEERKDEPDHGECVLGEVRMAGLRSSERCLRLGLRVRWEVGESGAGRGLKLGEEMDTSLLVLDSSHLDIEDVLNPATRSHAIHLTTSRTATLLASSRISLLCGQMPALLANGDEAPVPLALSIPLPSRQRPIALSIGVSALTGLVEVKDGGASEGDARSLRVKAATTAINEKGRLTEEVGTLLAILIAENVEMQMKLLGWTPIRRLPLRPQELAKTDLHPVTTVLVPLPTSPSTHYLSAKIGPTGLQFELIRLAKVASETGVGMKATVGDRMNLDFGKLRRRRGTQAKKRSRDDDDIHMEEEAPEPEEAPSGFQISTKDLREVYIFSNALVAQTIVEQQLKDRSIPHVLQYPPASGPGAPTSMASVAGIIPTIVVNTSDLLNDQRAGDVAMPRVYMQLKDWWRGEKCSVVTVVQLRHQSSLSDPGSSPQAPGSARASKAAKAEGIEFDQASSVVKFTASDISTCVPAFLEQWERLSKVVVVAGEVSRLNRSEPSFRDVRLLSFDLRTATLAYWPGYLASITYTSSSDSYVVTFARAGYPPSGSLGVSPTARLGLTPGAGGNAGSIGHTPAAGTGGGMGLTPAAQTNASALGAGTPATPGMREGNPHEPLAAALSSTLNQLMRNPSGISLGKEYIGLLRATLPLLLEIESIRTSSSFPSPPSGEYTYPALVVSDVKEYRIVYDYNNKRYTVDFVLVGGNDRYIICDGSRPRAGLVSRSCGTVEPIPDWAGVVSRMWETIKRDIKSGNNVDTPGGPRSPLTALTADNGAMKKGGRDSDPSGAKTAPPVMRLDGGKALMCETKVVAQLARLACDEVEKAILAARR